MSSLENTPLNEKFAKEVMTDFFVSCLEKSPDISEKDWLENQISKYLTDTPRKEIENFSEELFLTLKNFDDLAEDICNPHNSAYRPEIWMYRKLLQTCSEKNMEHLKNLCDLDELLSDVNTWLAEVSADLKRIKFDGDKLSYDDEDLEFFDEDFGGIIFPRGTNEKNSSRKKFLTKESMGNSLNKSIFNQFQRTAKTDLGHVDLRGRDFDEIAMGIGRNAALNGVGGIAVTTVLTVVMQGGLRQARLKDLMSLLMKTGASQSLRTAASGALKVIAEKGTIPILTRTTPVIVIAALAGIAIESSKIIWQCRRGEIGVMEAMDKIGRISTSIIFAVGFGAAGAMVGVAAFSVIPFAGPVVSGIVGSLIGEMSGNLISAKVGNFSYDKAKEIVSVVGNFIKEDIRMLEETNSSVPNKNKVKRKVKSG